MKDETLKNFIEGITPKEGRVKKFLRNFFHAEEQRHFSLARSFIKHLDLLEKIPISFEEKPKNNFETYLDAGELILTSLQTIKSKKAERIGHNLKRRLIALQYRLEAKNGGLDPLNTIDLNSYEELLEIGAVWKCRQQIFFDKMLTAKDKKQLRQISRYPEFVKLVRDDHQLQDKLLTWALRDKIVVEPFIEYPHLQEKINENHLNGRLGALGGEHLRVQKIDGNKVVTLPFEGKDYSILDNEAVIILQGNYRLTVGEIFKIFKEKLNIPHNLEFFLDGIMNWNVNCHGWWSEEDQQYHSINLDLERWWEQLPDVEILTREEAQQAYGAHMNGSGWNVSAMASRGSMTLDLFENHAYIEIVIPKDDLYHVYKFGKAATAYPVHPLERVMHICENLPASVCYPDDNFYFTHRQHVCHSFPITAEEGAKFMESIKHDIIRSREGNFVYQVESENCAEWTQEKLQEELGKERVPNLFMVPYLDSEPVGFLGKVLAFVKAFPRKVQKDLFMFLHLPLGAKRGRWIVHKDQKVWKSMTTHNFWKTGNIYLPAYLHKQLEKGIMPVSGKVKFCDTTIRTISK